LANSIAAEIDSRQAAPWQSQSRFTSLAAWPVAERLVETHQTPGQTARKYNNSPAAVAAEHFGD
jgi:hypothetical protein